jgi:hypothetical protein
MDAKLSYPKPGQSREESAQVDMIHSLAVRIHEARHPKLRVICITCQVQAQRELDALDREVSNGR